MVGAYSVYGFWCLLIYFCSNTTCVCLSDVLYPPKTHSDMNTIKQKIHQERVLPDMLLLFVLIQKIGSFQPKRDVSICANLRITM